MRNHSTKVKHYSSKILALIQNMQVRTEMFVVSVFLTQVIYENTFRSQNKTFFLYAIEHQHEVIKALQEVTQKHRAESKP